MKWPLPDISWADSTVMSFFWTISTSAKEGPLLIEILQKVQNKTGDAIIVVWCSLLTLNKGGKILRDKVWVWWKTSNKTKIYCSKENCALLFETTFSLQQMFSLHKWITRGERCKTSTQNLQRNGVAQHVEGICILYFEALTIHWSPILI